MSTTRHLFYHTFRGKKYSVCEITKALQKTCRGQCDQPNQKGRRIQIPIGKSPMALATQIHEFVHGCMRDLDDDCVEELSLSIAGALWKL